MHVKQPYTQQNNRYSHFSRIIQMETKFKNMGARKAVMEVVDGYQGGYIGDEGKIHW